MRIWRPKDKKAVATIKLTLWAALLTWAVFTVGFGVVSARMAVRVLSDLEFMEIWLWIVPIWIIFTSLMLVWAVLNFANKKLRGKE